MKISVWCKYHLIKVLGPIVTFIFSAIMLIMKFKLFAIFVWLFGPLCTAIILHSIKCPKCGKSIDNYTTLLSGPEDGWFSPMSKKCKNCGFNFCESEIKKYNKDNQK